VEGEVKAKEDKSKTFKLRDIAVKGMKVGHLCVQMPSLKKSSYTKLLAEGWEEITSSETITESKDKNAYQLPLNFTSVPESLMVTQSDGLVVAQITSTDQAESDDEGA